MKVSDFTVSLYWKRSRSILDVEAYQNSQLINYWKYVSDNRPSKNR